MLISTRGRYALRMLADLAEAKDIDGFLKQNGMECCECGCCSYVCPAHRPLAENNTAARGWIRNWEKAQKEDRKKAPEPTTLTKWSKL